MTDPRQYASCLLGSLFVGIAVDSVQAVTNVAELTPVPQAPPFVSGLMNLRGQIVTVLDLRQCLGVDDPRDRLRPVHLILRSEDECIGLLVDEVGDVLAIDEVDCEPPPKTLSDRSRRLITSVCKLDDRLLLILDTERILAYSGNEPGGTWRDPS
jgi:purine-binding chemotaxis protein CheW